MSTFGVYDNDTGGDNRMDQLDAYMVETFGDPNWFNRDFKIETNAGDLGGESSKREDEAQYAELHNLQPTPAEQKQFQQPNQDQHHQHRDDDGYGSQTVFISGMDPASPGDDFEPFTRERCHTWPSVQRVEDDGSSNVIADQRGIAAFRRQRQQHRMPFSPTGHPSRGSSNLSLISESNESLSATPTMGQMTPMKINQSDRNMGQWLVTSAAYNDQKDVVQDQFMNGPDSRHSSASETGEVNMKQPQPPPMAMTMTNYKAGHPSYVELITQAILSSPEQRMTLSEIYDWMVVNVPAFKDQRYLHSSSGWKNSVRHNLSLHSRFKRVKRNGMDKPSWWTVDLSEETKRERNNKRQPKQSRPRANTTTAAMLHRSSTTIASACHPSQTLNKQSGVVNRNVTIDTMATNGVYMATRHQSFSGSIPVENEHTGSQIGTSVASSRLVKAVVLETSGNERMEWSNFVEPKTEDIETPKSDYVSHAITVRLSDPPLMDGSISTSKPDIALTVTVSPESLSSAMNGQGVTLVGGSSVSHLVSAFRQSTLTDAPGRQLLRVQTTSGGVQEVSVPVPMPIRVVLLSNKECQTEQSTMTSPSITGGFWQGGSSKHGEITTLDECLMALTGELHSVAPEFGQTATTPNLISELPQQLMNQGSSQNVSTTVLASGYQRSDANFAPSGSHKISHQSMVHRQDGIQLPDDLVGLDVRGGFDCNIMDVLSYEMNCNTNGGGISGSNTSF